MRKSRDVCRSQASCRVGTVHVLYFFRRTHETVNGDDTLVAQGTDTIRDMITSLEREASAEARHKAHCDKEISESRAKERIGLAEQEQLTSSTDTKTAKFAQLKRRGYRVAGIYGRACNFRKLQI